MPPNDAKTLPTSTFSLSDLFGAAKNAFAGVYLLLLLSTYVVALILPSSLVTENPNFKSDYDVYTTASAATARNLTPYVSAWADNMLNYHYSPIFALLFQPLAALPFPWGRLVWAALEIYGYLLGLLVWSRLLIRHAGVSPLLVRQAMVVPLVMDVWASTQYIGNLSLILVLISGLLTQALLENKPRQAGLLTTLILLTKFQWAFPLFLLLVLKNRPLLARTLLWTSLCILSTVILTCVLSPVGPMLLMDYTKFLMNASGTFPLDGTTAMFSEVQNSIPQTFARYVGLQPWIQPVTAILRLGLVGGLIGIVIRQRRQTIVSGLERLGLIFVGFLTITLLLAQFEELILGGVIYATLWSTNRRTYRWTCLAFLPYAFRELPMQTALKPMLTVPVLLIAALSFLSGLYRLPPPDKKNVLPSGTGTRALHAATDAPQV